MSDTPLKPCPVPWCANQHVTTRHYDAKRRQHWVECFKCNFKTPQMPSKINAIAAWNTRQPTHSNIFDASDVQKHTLIVDPSYTIHAVEVKSLDDSQPTESDAEIIAENKRLREALKRIQHFSPAHMWRAPDIKVIISAALQEQSK